MAKLEPQRLKRPGEVEIKILPTKYRVGTVGEHRNRLLDMATGDYVCFVDDDDMVHDHYVDLLLKEIHEHSPDVIGWWMARWADGAYTGYAIHSISCGYYRTEVAKDGTNIWYRTPNHLNAVKAELAKDTAFPASGPNASYGEDTDYAQRLFPKLKRERFIPEFMYDYYYLSNANRIEHRLIFGLPPL